MTTAMSEETEQLPLLNDDCIFKILEMLPLKDIRSCSKASNRFRALCSNHVQRSQMDIVEIEISSKGYLQISCRNENVTHFDNFINRLRIGGKFNISKWPEQDLLASFVTSKCNENCSYEITITDGLDMYPYSEQMEMVLRNTKILNFTDTIKFDERHLSNFLKFCPNLTTLSVARDGHDEMIDAVLRQKYPKLKHFHLEFLYVEDKETALRPDSLKTFLLENDQIQCLELNEMYDPQDDPFGIVESTAMVKSIQNVVDFAPNLEYFFVIINNWLGNNFGEVYGSLEKLCGRSSFKTLELKTSENCLSVNAHQLAKLKKLKKMDLSSNRLYQLVSHNFQLFPNFWRQIEELTIYAFDYVEEASLLTYLTKFIQHMKHLKKVSVLTNVSIKDKVTFPISEMNAATTELEGAVEVTIFTNFVENTTNFDHTLVKLKRVECSSISSQRDCILCQWSEC